MLGFKMLLQLFQRQRYDGDYYIIVVKRKLSSITLRRFQM